MDEDPTDPGSNADQSSNRDAASLRIMGVFFVILSMLVLIGTYWTLGNPRAAIVNASSGVALGIVGGLMFAISRRLER